MNSQVPTNLPNPQNNLFHHGLIKFLVIDELKKQSKTWDKFLYQFSNSHLTVKTSKGSIDLGVVTPSKPHSPNTPSPPTQTIFMSEKKAKKIVDSPVASSGKKTKKHVDKSPMPSTRIDPQPKKLQDSFQQDFPSVPINRRGANRFKEESF
jgi:hypothetical protein